MDNHEEPNMDFQASTGHQIRGISGSTLKIIAIIAMLIDHIAAAVLEKVLIARGYTLVDNNQFLNDHQLLYYSYEIMRSIGRLAFPLFCFLLVEGFRHTRSIRKYALRLAVFALLSEIPFDLAFFSKPFYFGDQNVFFTLLIGVLVMVGFRFISERAADKKWLAVLAIIGVMAVGCDLAYTIMGIITNHIGLRSGLAGDSLFTIGLMGIVIAIVFSITALLLYLVIGRRYTFQRANVIYAAMAVLVIGMTIAEFLKTDYAGFGVLTIAVIYWLRRGYFISIMGGCATLTMMSVNEFPAFFALIPIWFYNGKRGLSLKYLFYIFYPVHLLLLYLICYFAGIL